MQPTQDMRTLPGARVTAPINSQGTPVQIKNGSCGHSVMQGVIRDAGGGYVHEGDLFAGKYRLRGTTGDQFGTELRRFGADVRVVNNVGLGTVRRCLARGDQVVVGIRTRLFGDHWVRVEHVDGTFVHYGDPWTGKSHAVTIDTFLRHLDPNDMVFIRWPNGVTVPPGLGRTRVTPAQAAGGRAGAGAPEVAVEERPGVSAELDRTLHEIGVKKNVQIVRGANDISVYVLGPEGEVTETIHYFPTSPSSTQRAAALLSRATLANPADVAMLLETGGRVLFLYDTFRSVLELHDPETSLNLLEKYAQVLHDAARAAEAGDWTQASDALQSWSMEMARLGGPFSGMGAGFLLWLQDHWLITFGADALSHMPPRYLMWLYKRYMDEIARLRRQLAHTTGTAVEPEGPATDQPAPVAAEPEPPAAAPVPPQPTFSGLSASDLDQAIARESNAVADLNTQIADVSATRDYFRNWLEQARATLAQAPDDAGSDTHYSSREQAQNEIKYVERQLAYSEEKLAGLEERLAEDRDRLQEYGEARAERPPADVVQVEAQPPHGVLRLMPWRWAAAAAAAVLLLIGGTLLFTRPQPAGGHSGTAQPPASEKVTSGQPLRYQLLDPAGTLTLDRATCDEHLHYVWKLTGDAGRLEGASATASAVGPGLQSTYSVTVRGGQAEFSATSPGAAWSTGPGNGCQVQGGGTVTWGMTLVTVGNLRAYPDATLR